MTNSTAMSRNYNCPSVDPAWSASRETAEPVAAAIHAIADAQRRHCSARLVLVSFVLQHELAFSLGTGLLQEQNQYHPVRFQAQVSPFKAKANNL